MGTKYEVNAWVKTVNKPEDEPQYEWVNVYRGQNVFRAVVEATKAKRYAGCVKLEWRG